MLIQLITPTAPSLPTVPWVKAHLVYCLIVSKMLVGAFNQEKALVWAFSVIV